MKIVKCTICPSSSKVREDGGKSGSTACFKPVQKLELWVKHLVSKEHQINAYNEYRSNVRRKMPLEEDRFVLTGLPDYLPEPKLFELAAWLTEFGDLVDMYYMRSRGICIVALQALGIQGQGKSVERLESLLHETVFQFHKIKVYRKNLMTVVDWDEAFRGSGTSSGNGRKNFQSREPQDKGRNGAKRNGKSPEKTRNAGSRQPASSVAPGKDYQKRKDETKWKVKIPPPTEVEVPVTPQPPTVVEVPVTPQPPTVVEVPVAPQPPTEVKVPVAPKPPTEVRVPVTPQPPTEVEVPMIPKPPTEVEVPVTPQPPTEVEVPVTPQPPIAVEVSVTPKPPTEVEVPVTPQTPAKVEVPVTPQPPTVVEVSVTPAEVTPASTQATATEKESKIDDGTKDRSNEGVTGVGQGGPSPRDRVRHLSDSALAPRKSGGIAKSRCRVNIPGIARSPGASSKKTPEGGDHQEKR